MAEESSMADAVEMAAELSIAWLSNPKTRASAAEASDFLKAMHEAVMSLSAMAAPDGSAKIAKPEPTVSARRSLSSPEHIVSMIDGRPYKSLRRHLSRHGLTPEQYRERYGLKPDYPMVAPAYAELRRSLAKKIGLGRKSRGGAQTSGPKATGQKRVRRSPRTS